MKRKVIKIGPATLVISLPADWTKKFNIKKGDELEVIELDRTLQLNTEKEFGLNKKLINISDYNPLIMRTIGMLYKIGYNEIKIIYDKNKKNYRGEEFSELDLLKRAVESYSGMDIEEIRQDKDGNYMLVLERSSLIPSEFKKTLDQSFRHLCYMSEEVGIALKENNKNILTNVNLTDNLINQTTNFCQKVLNKHGYEEYTKTTLVYIIVVEIEKLGDKYRIMYENYSKDKFKINKDILKIYNRIDEILNELYSLYRKFDKKKLTYIGDNCQSISKELEKLMENCSKKEIKIIFELYNINESIYDILEPLIGFNHEQIN